MHLVAAAPVVRPAALIMILAALVHVINAARNVVAVVLHALRA